MLLKFSSDARKQIKKLPKPERLKVIRKIQILKENPYLGKKLKGKYENLRSFKAWPYRIIYNYSPQNQLLFIDAIEHRQQVYK